MKYSRNQIKTAGKIFKEKQEYSKEEIEFAEDVLTYWRTIHGKIINKFQENVKNKALQIDSNAFFAKRLKRSPSIIKKLKRLNHIQLSTMQDIAGMRIVVSSMTKLNRLVKFLKSESFEHELKGIDDYLINPKESGYRSIHLIYKYKSQTEPELNGLFIELQIRTYKQHAWATAVETMGTYLNSHLKFNEGKPKWLKYFALTSSAFTFLEKTNQIPNYDSLSEYETFRQAIYEYNYNKIEDSLKAYSIVSEIICDSKNEDKMYHIVKLDTSDKTVSINSYSEDQIETANQIYTQLERNFEKNSNVNLVLVSTDKIQELREAYPNYFLDTKEFFRNMSIIRKRYNKLKTTVPNIG